MGKIIYEGTEARDLLKNGINAVVDTVKVTIGPKGRNVKTSKGTFNDGGLISEDISFTDKPKQMGASMAKNVIAKTSEAVGGGRTASAILFQSLVVEGQKFVEMGANVNLLRLGMKNAVVDVIERLKGISKPVSTQEELQQVATISTESEELGKVIAEVVYKIGKDGVANVEDGQSFGISTEFVEGLKFDKGYVSPWMATNIMSTNPEESMQAMVEDVDVYVTDKKLNTFDTIIDYIGEKGTDQSGKPTFKVTRPKLLVIAEDFDERVINMAVLSRSNGIHIILVKIPGFGDDKTGWLEDIKGMTGATDIQLGHAKKVIVTEKTTSIIEGKAGDYVERLKARRDATDNKYTREKLDQRVANVSNGVAVIKIGAASNEELKYLKKKIEDGISEAKRALEEGIVPGGDVAFVNAVKMLQSREENTDEAHGYNIVLKAIEAPLRQIITNAHASPEVILAEIKKSKSNTIGYDALKEEVTDMFERGIIDATKVARTALENAASEAGMFLTIEKLIVEEEITNNK